MTKDETLKMALDFLMTRRMGAEAVIEALNEALAQPVQEQQQAQLDVIAVNLMREGINKHRARELADHFVNFTLTPPLPVQEPLEYWNAVEGWVKIDEVREHFDAVNCGTIYKHGGEGRVPLYTAPPQREWVGLTVTTILNMMPSTIPADYDGELMEFARAVEAKLKDKNHG